MQLTELELSCNEPEQTRRFYRDCLSFPPEPHDASGLTFDAGQTRLIFKETRERHPTYHFAFTVPSNKLEEAYAYIGRRIPILPLPGQQERIMNFTAWNAKAFYAYDNNGNILEFIARYDLNNPSDQPFTGRSVVSISEIGIVADVPVREMAGRLIRQYGIAVFARQPPADHFTVLGSDEGLLIIVPRNRCWFPTSLPAGLFRTRIRFKNEQGILQTIVLNGEDEEAKGFIS